MFFIESVDLDLEWPVKADSVIVGTVYRISSKSFLKKAKNEIWKMIQDSYEKIGGYKGHDNVRSLIKDCVFAKIVFSKDGLISAIAFYSNRFGGHKRFCSAKNSLVRNSKNDVVLIARDDILDYDGYYWVEASLGIEKIFKENGGNPVPNVFAHEFLKLNESQLELDDDEVHYVRRVGRNHEKIRKMIFGFKDRDTAERVCSSVANYHEFRIRKNAEAVLDQLSESISDRKIEYACIVANRLAEFRNEWGCCEMFPEWRATALEARKILKKASVDGNPQAKACLEAVNYCLEEMPLIKVRRFFAENA